MYIKARKHMYNRRERGTEVDGTWWTTEAVAQGKEREATSSCKMGCGVLRMRREATPSSSCKHQLAPWQFVSC